MPAVRIVTEEDVPSVPTTVHTFATRSWTLSGNYATAPKDRHKAIWFSAHNHQRNLQ